MVELIQQATLTDDELVHYAQFSENPLIRRLSDIVDRLKEEQNIKDAQIGELNTTINDCMYDILFAEGEQFAAKQKLAKLSEEMHNIRNTKKTNLIATNNKQAETIKNLTKQLQEVEARLNTWNIMAK
jgi:hypothetical protein